MAVIDPLSDALVIRVIYDGAPYAGKTTSVRALGSGLGSAVTSPGEIGGRTLFFDWLDYTGGLFEGRRIRCQIVSVPGQAVLAPRRRRLLDSADVVVYVLDSSAAAFGAERGYLEGLRATLARREGPAVGVVVQANKRDLPDAVPVADLRQMLHSVGLTAAVVETNAAASSGIRESFVLAVRLALDRVRELLRAGQLKTEPPDINDQQALLDDLQSHDQALAPLGELAELPHTRLSDLNAPPPPPAATLPEPISTTQVAATADPAPAPEALPLAAQALIEALADNAPPVAATAAEAASADAGLPPLAPDDRVASGLTWPVVVGRTILNEITGRPWQVVATADGGWRGGVDGRWQLVSPPNASFTDVEHGRETLVRWARMHVGAAAILSPERCIVLGNDRGGRVRLWQVVRHERPLAAQLQDAARQRDARPFIVALLACSIALSEIYSRLEVIDVAVSAGLDDLALREQRVVFIGAMPSPDTGAATRANITRSLDALLDREFVRVRDALDARRCELSAFLEQPAALIRQALDDTSGDGAAALGAFVRQASPERLEQAILQLTALMVAA